MLSLGAAGISAIARKSKQNRVTTYEVINRLIEKRLVILSFAGKKKVYTAESPDSLKQLIKQKLEKLDSILPELFALVNKTTVKPKIRYYEGVEGIKQAYMATVSSLENTIIGFVGAEQLTVRDDMLKTFWETEYVPARRKNNKMGKIIVPDNAHGKDLKLTQDDNYREVRLIPASQYNFEAEILAVDDIITLISYSNEEAFAISLQSKPIANTVKMIFKIVWNQAY
ncbi:MAG: hypothetical protein WC810_27240 [Janthinobacterium sp.]|jgi:sugar-specific transcriptional regulator TrmB